MGVKYLWDSNIAIYYLQRQFPLPVEQFIDGILKENQPFLSAISEIELLCWKSPLQRDTDLLQGFLDDSLIIELDKRIKLTTADIRKVHKVKLPDAIIAATAIVYNLSLITRNTSDFKKIEGLTIVDPWDELTNTRATNQ